MLQYQHGFSKILKMSRACQVIFFLTVGKSTDPLKCQVFLVLTVLQKLSPLSAWSGNIFQCPHVLETLCGEWKRTIR